MNTFLQNVQEIGTALSEFAVMKLVSSYVLVIAIYLVGLEHVPLVGILTTLVTIDLVTGTYAAFVTKDTITSRKMVKTAIKWTLYMLMISSAHLTDALIPGNWYLEEVTLAFLGATELISVLENIGKSGVAIPRGLLLALEKWRGDQ